MSITTQPELLTAASNWLNRSDLSGRLEEFIAIAEAGFNRRLRTRDQMTRSTTSATTQYVSLPSDFLQARNVNITSTSPPKRLVYLTPDRADDYRESFDNTTGIPEYYTIAGDAMELLKTPDGTYTLQIQYFAKVPALTSSNTTNWLLTSHPDAYLYSTLMAAEPFLMNDARLQTWASLSEKAIQEIVDADDASRYAGGTLAARPITTYS
tara:strand:+ start:2537 stop:3166 length:630 start_codon:yes stop_codon:yes gene_type:complete